ncbi:MAG: hypothetical protein RIQ92_31 [Actinomycetota bacterium]|jgi:uncharacterized protein (DUF305 family)
MVKKLALFGITLALVIVTQPAHANSHAGKLKNLGINEIMFAQGMIPHHQQAIEISNFALRQSKNASVRKLASQIIKAQKPEINQMKYWLTAKVAPMEMGHDMGMSGMPSETKIAELKRLTGIQFDLAFLNAMIEHHQGALEMLPMLSSSKNSEAKLLAKSIRAMQSGEISYMRILLKNLQK